MNMDRKHLLVAFGWGILGFILGIYMAASKDHSHFVTHAHIMLVGFVVSFIYAACHKLWLSQASGSLASMQYYIHLLASIVLNVGLFLLYAQWVQEEILGPILGISSIAILVSFVMMKVMLIRSFKP